MDNSPKIAKTLRYIARAILLAMALLWLVFALLSGAEAYGGGIAGIIKNSPNALPWLILLILVYVAWRWELLGGIIVVLLGIFTIFAFNVFNNLPVLFLVTIPLVVLGIFFILAWYLSQKPKQEKPVDF